MCEGGLCSCGEIGQIMCEREMGSWSRSVGGEGEWGSERTSGEEERDAGGSK